MPTEQCQGFVQYQQPVIAPQPYTYMDQGKQFLYQQPPQNKMMCFGNDNKPFMNTPETQCNPKTMSVFPLYDNSQNTFTSNRPNNIFDPTSNQPITYKSCQLLPQTPTLNELNELEEHLPTSTTQFGKKTMSAPTKKKDKSQCKTAHRVLTGQ